MTRLRIAAVVVILGIVGSAHDASAEPPDDLHISHSTANVATMPIAPIGEPCLTAELGFEANSLGDHIPGSPPVNSPDNNAFIFLSVWDHQSGTVLFYNDVISAPGLFSGDLQSATALVGFEGERWQCAPDPTCSADFDLATCDPEGQEPILIDLAWTGFGPITAAKDGFTAHPDGGAVCRQFSKLLTREAGVTGVVNFGDYEFQIDHDGVLMKAATKHISKGEECCGEGC